LVYYRHLLKVQTDSLGFVVQSVPKCIIQAFFVSAEDADLQSGHHVP